jgi:hypothetical protein
VISLINQLNNILKKLTNQNHADLMHVITFINARAIFFVYFSKNLFFSIINSTLTLSILPIFFYIDIPILLFVYSTTASPRRQELKNLTILML